MGMPAARPVTTIEALLALPEDGLRHELLDGEHVVTPAPSLRHQLILGKLHHALTEAISERDDVEIFMSPADVQLGPRTLVQPDLFIIASDAEGRPKDWHDIGTPLLAIEILSPSTAARDRGRKRRIYLETGVEEYWIVDMDALLVERWRAGDARPEIVDGELEWQLNVGPHGTIELPALFRHLER